MVPGGANISGHSSNIITINGVQIPTLMTTQETHSLKQSRTTGLP
jgi:hypothetical protein